MKSIYNKQDFISLLKILRISISSEFEMGEGEGEVMNTLICSEWKIFVVACILKKLNMTLSNSLTNRKSYFYLF